MTTKDEVLGQLLRKLHVLCGQNGIPFMAMYRLLKPEGEKTLKKLLFQIEQDYYIDRQHLGENSPYRGTDLAEMKRLQDIGCFAKVDAVQPHAAELKDQFDLVHSIYEDSYFMRISKDYRTASSVGKKRFELEQVKYGQWHDVDVQVRGTGLKDATFEELLAFDRAFPELQKCFPIVARGSVIGDGCCPILWDCMLKDPSFSSEEDWTQRKTKEDRGLSIYRQTCYYPNNFRLLLIHL